MTDGELSTVTSLKPCGFQDFETRLISGSHELFGSVWCLVGEEFWNEAANPTPASIERSILSTQWNQQIGGTCHGLEASRSEVIPRGKPPFAYCV